MKFNIESQLPSFKPINLNITIESVDELIELIGRLNISALKISECMNECYKGSFNVNRFHNYSRLFSILDEIAIDNNILHENKFEK